MLECRYLTLHIGRAKTGSTDLQYNLAANRDHLREHGFVYPLAATKHSQGLSHADLALAYFERSPANEDDRRRLKRELNQEIRGAEKVILSCEGFQNILKINLLTSL
jgi:hypothetical protein